MTIIFKVITFSYNVLTNKKGKNNISKESYILGYTEHLEDAFEGTSVTISALAVGFYNGMWAYDGW